MDFMQMQATAGLRQQNQAYPEEWPPAAAYPYPREHDCQRNLARHCRPYTWRWRAECHSINRPDCHVSVSRLGSLTHPADDGE
jgi:hypothetical protein